MMDTQTAWNGPDHNMTSTSQDDFQQLLDMSMGTFSEGLNFDFPDFTGQNAGQMLSQEDGRMDVDVTTMTTSISHPTMTSVSLELERGHSSSESLVELDAQIQYLQQQREQRQQQQQQQQQQQRQMREQQQQQQQQQQRNNFYAQARLAVPPTPSSIEMHSANQPFYAPPDPQQQALYERYQQRLKEQELAFTPLVSPAVTPLEAHFTIPEFTVPGAYFSPLSSPALHAQNEHRSVYDRRGPTSASNSPVDVNMDVGQASAGTGSLAKKVTKKAATTKPRTPRAIKQSPIVKPHRRRGTGTTISSQALADLVEPARQEPSLAPSSTRSRASTEGSEEDSISPEHLSDMNMAPPPLPTPGSAGRSPFLPSQRGPPRMSQVGGGNAMSPATPASLMRLSKADQNSPVVSDLGDGDDQTMDGFTLPEPANPARPRPPRIVTLPDGQVTPVTEPTSAATPSFQSLPSPAFSRAGMVGSASSPQLSSLNATSAPRKVAPLSARGSKKRASVSSVQVSPALRPKISPSIKPLIRGSASVSEDTASLLLASKSNYQNILEGTHLPGVSYPTELSTNLTSKRTSHKIAEQGRRNRINSALQEIATLLPRGRDRDSGTEKGSGSGDAAEGKGAGNGGVGGQSANSKASTVEHAIEYIKQLKREVADATRRAEEAEKALELKRL